MAFRTENAMYLAPGMIFGSLDGGGMLIDRNSGEYVPAEQVLRDPLHLCQIDILDEDHLGCLRIDITGEEADGDENTDPEEEDTPTTRFLDRQEELDALIAEQEVDMGMVRVTSTKGRHSEFGNDKGNSKPRSGGRRQAYKDPRSGHFRVKYTRHYATGDLIAPA